MPNLATPLRAEIERSWRELGSSAIDLYTQTKAANVAL
jgi:hypothetical protein